MNETITTINVSINPITEIGLEKIAFAGFIWGFKSVVLTPRATKISANTNTIPIYIPRDMRKRRNRLSRFFLKVSQEALNKSPIGGRLVFSVISS